MINTKNHLFWNPKTEKSIRKIVQVIRISHKLVTHKITAKNVIYPTDNYQTPLKYKAFEPRNPVLNYFSTYFANPLHSCFFCDIIFRGFVYPF